LFFKTGNRFITRSFLALVYVDNNGTTENPELGKLNFVGGDGKDSFDLQVSDDPEYVMNALVDVDGGTGNDTLTIVGTEAGDKV
jgi:hypothetical protein